MTVNHEARAEDVRWLAATGESASGAARRMGLSLDGLEKWCRLYSINDWRRLLENERAVGGIGARRGRVLA